MIAWGSGGEGRVAEDFLAGFRRGLMEAGKRGLDVEMDAILRISVDCTSNWFWRVRFFFFLAVFVLSQQLTAVDVGDRKSVV